MSRGPCSECAHLSPGRSTVDQVQQLRPSYLRARSAKTIQDLREIERRTAETQGITAQHLDMEPEVLGYRPTVFNYCGLQEVEGRWMNWVRKNAFDPGGTYQCSDFEPLDRAGPAARSCSTCTHRVNLGEDLYARLTQVFADLTGALGIEGQSFRQTTKDLVESVTDSLQAEAGLELEDAFEGTGELRRRPSHLPWCAALSTDGAFVVGDIRNAGQRCPRWEGGPPPPGDPAGHQAWQLLAGRRGQLEEATRALRGMHHLDIALYKPQLTNTRFAFTEAVVAWVRLALAGLGFSPAETERTASELHAGLVAAWGGRDPFGPDIPAPMPMPEAQPVPAEATPGRGRSGGLLGRLFDVVAGSLSTDRSAPGPVEASGGTAPGPLPAAGRTLLGPGVNFHPGDSTFGIHLELRGTEAVLTFGETSGPQAQGSILASAQIWVALAGPDKVVITDAPGVPPMPYDCGKPYPLTAFGVHAKWHSGSRSFPARVGFEGASGRSGPALRVFVEWLPAR